MQPAFTAWVVEVSAICCEEHARFDHLRGPYASLGDAQRRVVFWKNTSEKKQKPINICLKNQHSDRRYRRYYYRRVSVQPIYKDLIRIDTDIYQGLTPIHVTEGGMAMGDDLLYYVANLDGED